MNGCGIWCTVCEHSMPVQNQPYILHCCKHGVTSLYIPYTVLRFGSHSSRIQLHAKYDVCFGSQLLSGCKYKDIRNLTFEASRLNLLWYTRACVTDTIGFSPLGMTEDGIAPSTRKWRDEFHYGTLHFGSCAGALVQWKWSLSLHMVAHSTDDTCKKV